MHGSMRALLVTVAASAVLGTAAVPAGAASSRSPSVSIVANSHLQRVSGDVLVAYSAGKFASATISGTVTDGHGDRIRLFALRFNNRTFTPDGPSRAVGGKYSFTVQPSVETRYLVELTSGHSVVAKSKSVAVYVEATVRPTGGGACRRSPCMQTLHVSVHVPPSAYRREVGKHWFLYSGLRLGRPGHIPPLPRFLSLDRHARASKARRARADEFLVTLRFTFNIRGDSYRLAMNYCTKDSLAADGLGLPGHHFCGNRRIKLNARYLG